MVRVRILRRNWRGHRGAVSRLARWHESQRSISSFRLLKSGAWALLTKPIDFGTLRSEIDMRVGSAA